MIVELEFFMRRLAVFALALSFSTAVIVPAGAQYYRDGYYPPPPPRGYDPYDGPRRGYGGPPPPGYYGGRSEYRARFGRVCLTSRGSCYIGRPVPLNSPCRCDIPGFGLKRGAVGE